MTQFAKIPDTSLVLVAIIPNKRDLDIARTLEFYKKRYVDQLAKVRAVNAATVIADNALRGG